MRSNMRSATWPLRQATASREQPIARFWSTTRKSRKVSGATTRTRSPIENRSTALANACDDTAAFGSQRRFARVLAKHVQHVAEIQTAGVNRDFDLACGPGASRCCCTNSRPSSCATRADSQASGRWSTAGGCFASQSLDACDVPSDAITEDDFVLVLLHVTRDFVASSAWPPVGCRQPDRGRSGGLCQS